MKKWMLVLMFSSCLFGSESNAVTLADMREAMFMILEDLGKIKNDLNISQTERIELKKMIVKNSYSLTKEDEKIESRIDAIIRETTDVNSSDKSKIKANGAGAL